MSRQKHPLHEVLSNELAVSRQGFIARDKSIVKSTADEVGTILRTLLKGKMKATDAHEIAGYHAGLPDLLRSAGQAHLAKFAEEVLNDLRNREDEKKEVSVAVHEQ